MARCANEGVGCQRGGALIPIVRSRFPLPFHRTLTAHHRVESAADIRVTRDQFAEVFGETQSASAAGAPSSGVAPEAAGGLSAGATSEPPPITTNSGDAATSAPTATNDNEPTAAENEAGGKAVEAEPEVEGPELEASNDTEVHEPPPATGTDHTHQTTRPLKKQSDPAE